MRSMSSGDSCPASELPGDGREETYSSSRETAPYDMATDVPLPIHEANVSSALAGWGEVTGVYGGIRSHLRTDNVNSLGFQGPSDEQLVAHWYLLVLVAPGLRSLPTPIIAGLPPPVSGQKS